MIERILEPEVMDDPAEVIAYDQMDHGGVNKAFVEDWVKAAGADSYPGGTKILDVGTGTALIPIEMVRVVPKLHVVAVDMAQSMLDLAGEHLKRLGLAGQIELKLCDAKRLPFGDGAFAGVVSNSIIHHIPEPLHSFWEMARVCAPGGMIFVRDLCRPATVAEIDQLVELHAKGADATQKKLFWDSLHAALTLDEAAEMAYLAGLDPQSVTMTSDRHWTLAARK